MYEPYPGAYGQSAKQYLPGIFYSQESKVAPTEESAQSLLLFTSRTTTYLDTKKTTRYFSSNFRRSTKINY